MVQQGKIPRGIPRVVSVGYRLFLLLKSLFATKIRILNKFLLTWNRFERLFQEWSMALQFLDAKISINVIINIIIVIINIVIVIINVTILYIEKILQLILQYFFAVIRKLYN